LGTPPGASHSEVVKLLSRGRSQRSPDPEITPKSKHDKE